jgi:site-specific DNA-methyltransferase (adenine-specific)/adenine-specific DNA-methyltransferase
MDEVFNDGNFQNEIIWHYKSFHGQVSRYFPRKHDVILFYKKSDGAKFTLMRNEDVAIEDMIDFKNWGKYIVNENEIRGNYMPTDVRFKRNLDKWLRNNKRKPTKDDVIYVFRSQPYDDVWDINYLDPKDTKERTSYPTQKPEVLLERILKSSTNEGDLVLDCFCGSGTTIAVAQKLGRRWIGCDINLGAIQTSTKRLNQIIGEQKAKKDFKGSLGFKVLNVNEYTAFKNELEAKEIVMGMYGVEPMKRSYFDGVLDTSYVKVMPMNRVLNKLDMKTLLKNVNDKLADFTVKKKSKSGEPVYDEGVLIICSGMDLEVADYLKKENKSGVKIDVRDITTDKKNLVFKKPPEAKIEVKAKDKKLSVSLKEFYSPILMRKLEIENSKALKKEYQAKVEDFRQIIDSVAIDVDYTGDLFNAEIMDLPTKRELIKADYSWEYAKKGKYTVAVKIVDVLGEECFETFEITA